ncbi:MAG: PfaB family protein [Proteobacteria bacterium]|nr:PfaB family protein [Pseudomonadota bacterium]
MKKVAIIGMSCLFPGAISPQEFYQNLLDHKDSTSQATSQQMGLDPDIYYSKNKGTPDRYYNLKGGYIKDFQFDAKGYDLKTEDLNTLDDLDKWSLYVAKEALKDAGYLTKKEVLRHCGLLLGNLSFPTKNSNKSYLPLYNKLVESTLQQLPGLETLNFPDGSTTGNRHHFDHQPDELVSRALSLGGPTFRMDAACATSLYSIKLACDYLNSNKADLMLAGAVSAGDPFFINMGFSTFQAFPENGISAPFDENSKGLFAGEGAGLVVLKRYDDAVRDNDQIYASISGIGLSNDGSGKFILNPDSKGQIKALERAYADSKISPSEVSYLECHATGTPVGDKVELATIENFFSETGTPPLLGSVKSNVGHLLTAAGITSIIKTVMSMTHKRIPASIKISSPQCSPENTIGKEQILRKNIDWPQGGTRQIAAVNSFGFGGTNAHLILEREETPSHKDNDQETAPTGKVPLSIIGMEARFGDIHNLREYEQTIHQRRVLLTDIPEGRWKGLESQLLNNFPGAFPKKAALMNTFEFDFFKYKIPPSEKDPLITQQLLMLDVAELAIEDSKINKGANTAVIIAMERDNSIHQMRGRIELEGLIKQAIKDSGLGLTPELELELIALAKDSIQNPVGMNQFTSFIGNLIASRISARWDFSGPSFTISSGENSAYQALEIAQMMLVNDEVESVVIGSVDLAGNLEEFLDNKNKNEAFRGEGAGALVLSRKDRSEGLQSYATLDELKITPSKINCSVNEPLSKFLRQKKNSISEIGYIEISGSNGWNQVELDNISKNINENKSVAIGSIQHQIGHCGVASGIAGMIKTILCLDHRYIPGSSFNHSDVDISDSPLYQMPYSKAWHVNQREQQRQALVYGIDPKGSDAFLLLSENRSTNTRPGIAEPLRKFVLILINEHSQGNLIARLDKLQHEISKCEDIHQFATDCYKIFNNSSDEYTLALVGNSKDKLLMEIQSALSRLPACFLNNSEWKTPIGSYFTPHPLGKQGKTAFVYPGAFTSYIGMERDLFHIFPQLFEHIPSYTSSPENMFCDKMVHPRSFQKLSAATLKDLDQTLMRDTIAMFETGINSTILNTLVLRDIFKIYPHAAFGYSMGEVSMMFALNVWPDTDEMSGDVHSGPLFNQRIAGPMNLARESWGLPAWEKGNENPVWAAYNLKSKASDIRNEIKNFKRVFLIIINTPEESVIAGYPEDCKALIEKLKCQATAVHIGDIVHCDLVKSEYDLVKNLNTLPIQNIPETTLYATTDGQQITNITSEQLGKNIAEMYCKTADFSTLIQNVHKDGARIFIEMGPRGASAGMIETVLKGKEHTTVTLHRKGGDQYQNVLRAIAKLCSHRISMDLSAIFQRSTGSSEQRKKFVKTQSLCGTNTAEIILKKENKNRFSANDKTILYNEQDITEFSCGSITKCFGKRYDVYDGRKSPRTPNGDLQLISRVLELKGTPGDHKQASSLVSEFDVPDDSWYYLQNSHPGMPYSILMEIALQPCGFLSTYMGCTLIYPDVELNFRNLDSTAKLLDIPDLRGKTITATSKLTTTAASAQTIIVIFDYTLSVEGNQFYEGNTCFGYFSTKALKEQVGLDKGDKALPWYQSEKTDVSRLIEYDFRTTSHRSLFYDSNPAQPHFKLAGNQLDFLDKVILVRDGGQFKAGYIYAEKTVDPESWFFPCHFYKDPVMPGSLGVEAMLETLRIFAINEKLGARFASPRFDWVVGTTIWKYRGQIIPTNKTMSLETHVTSIEETGDQIIIKGDASLWKDGIRIYEVRDLAISIKEK